MTILAPLGGQFLVNTWTDGYQLQPGAGELTDGGYVIAYNSAHNGVTNVYEQRYTAAGVKVGGEVQVTTGGTFNSGPAGEWSTGVARLAGGGHAVVWQGSDADSIGVQIQLFDSAGAKVGGETVVNSTAANWQEMPRVANLSGGGFVVTWQSKDQDGSGYGVFGQRFDASGAKAGGEFQINSQTAGNQDHIKIAPLSGGGFIVGWLSGSSFYTQQYNALGQALGGEHLVEHAQGAPSIAALANGGYAITWSAFGSPSGVSYFTQSFDAADTKVGSENLFFANPTFSSPPVSIGLADGGYAVTWTGHTSAGYFDYLQRFDANSVAQAPPLQVGATTFAFGLPALAALGSGLLTAIALDDGSQAGIFAQAFVTSTPADAHTLTAGVDVIVGTADDTQITTVPANLGAADALTGGAGLDSITLAQAGVLDLTAPLVFSGFEQVIGSGDKDSVIVSNDRLAGVQLIDGKAGFDSVTTAHSRLDLSGITLASIERITTTRSAGTAFTVDTLGKALLVQGGSGADSVIAAALTFSDADRAQIFNNAVETIVDSAGIHHAPVPAVLAPLAPGYQVRVDTSGATPSPPLGSATASVTALDGGGHVVVWSGGSDGSSPGVHLQRFNAAGAKVGVEVLVNTTTANEQTDPSVTHLAGGGYVVAWTSWYQDGSLAGIYEQRFGAADQRLGSEILVNTQTSSTQSAPVIAALSGGGHVVAWQSYGDQDGSDIGVYAQRFGADGAKLGGEFLVNTATFGSQYAPALSALDGGGFAISWTSLGDVYVQRFSSDGAKVGGEVRANTNIADDQTYSAVAGLPGGGFVVTWQSGNQDGSQSGIYAQRFGADGLPKGLETRVNTTTDSIQESAAVAALADGSYLVTWHSFDQDGSGWGVFGQRFDLAGVKVGGEFLVNAATAGNQLFPAVAGLSDGGVVVAWSDQNATIQERLFSIDPLAPIVGGPDADALSGTSHTDTLDGQGGDDSLRGGAGDDHLFGGEGRDSLDGQAGNDDMHGGAGDDLYRVDSVGDGVVEGADEGVDKVISMITFTLGANVEKLNLAGHLAIDGTGNDLANTINGNDAANTLWGLGGKDSLSGGAGDDHLLGGDGADKLKGGAGADLMEGGAGADRFVFAALTDFGASPHLDVIADFSHAEGDRIQLLGIDADANTAGDQAFAYIGVAAFGHHAGELHTVAVTGGLQVEGDLDGDGTADFAFLVQGVASLTGADFIL